MASIPRHDQEKEEREERQRQQRQQREERDRRSDNASPDDNGRYGDDRGPDDRGGGDRRQLLEDKPHDFIERTRPEDRLDDTSHHGQLTRDNVNPNIPSVKRDDPMILRDPGGIVDPNSLGMSQAQEGTPPPQRTDQPEQWPERDPVTGQAAPREGQPEQQSDWGTMGSGVEGSINEPPGSSIGSNVPEEPPPEPLPEGAEAEGSEAVYDDEWEEEDDEANEVTSDKSRSTSKKKKSKK